MSKIKVLKDTPFDKANTLLTIEEWRERYSYIVNKSNSDLFLINYLKKGYKNDFFSSFIEGYFEVIESEFKVGDWVWNEKTQTAFKIVEDSYTHWLPNECTINAVNQFSETYKRKAIDKEIEYYSLESYCNGKVLIGQYKCYYFNNVWEELKGIVYNIKQYLTISKHLGEIYTIDTTWNCKPNGLKVGCTEVSHEDILKIAKQLKLI